MSLLCGEADLPDGFETNFYVNPVTWLIERQRDRRAYHPSSDPREITVESVQDRFMRLCGVPLERRRTT